MNLPVHPVYPEMLLTVLAIWSFLRQPATPAENPSHYPQLFEGLARPMLWAAYPFLTAGASYYAYLAAIDLGFVASAGAVALGAAAAVSLGDLPLVPPRREMNPPPR
jgi:hypothetical protein